MAAKTSKRPARGRGNTATGKRLDAYQIITDRIVTALEQGVVPWQRPWHAAIDGPRSLSSRKAYQGINVFMLLLTAHANGYASPWWGTYRQIAERGGQVRKGEKGTPVVFWRVFEVDDAKAKDGKRNIPMLRHFTVFNADQCDELTVPASPPELEFTPREAAERVVAGYVAGGPTLTHRGNEAAYSPQRDAIYMPKQTSFKSVDGYYATLFHEATHSTGHASRLSRDGVTDPVKFGSEKYGREELIAEMGAAFLCGETGIAPRVDQHAAYLQSWLSAVKGDPKLVVQAAGAAQKAANLVLGRTPGDSDGEEAS